MTHSSNALNINETYEPLQLYLPTTTTTIRTPKTTAIETPATTTTTTSAHNINDLNFIKRGTRNSWTDVSDGNGGNRESETAAIAFNNIPGTSTLSLRKPTTTRTATAAAASINATITTKIKNYDLDDVDKKKPSPINNGRDSAGGSGHSNSSSSSKISDSITNNGKSITKRHDENENNNDNENNENDIYSCYSIESLSLDTYSSTSTTAEAAADTTITTNTTNTTLVLESCCSTKSLQQLEKAQDKEMANEHENEKEDGKRKELPPIDNKTNELTMAYLTKPPSSSKAANADIGATTAINAASKIHATNKSPMYIIKIQTIQLKQSLAGVHKRRAQSKCRKSAITNTSTSKALASIHGPFSTRPSTTAAHNANTATTKTTTVIGIGNGEGECDAEVDENNGPRDIADVIDNNKMRHSCATSHLTSALNDKSGFGMTNVHKRTLSSSSYRSGISHFSVRTVNSTISAKPACKFWSCLRWLCIWLKNSGVGEPSVHHALVVIFLEFFAWGLLTMPVIAVLNQTFPDHTFLMNGLVMGIKGILSFLSAPLIGALSDIWGRKFFLLITVFFTCAPIPLMTINTWWFFAMISISGIFAVTFSVVFAYVADVTTVEGRSRAYGLVSATFAASLVISPALGAALMEKYSDTLVVALATAIAVLDVFFILVAVPESLPDKVRPSSWGAPINWEQADPFAALRKVGSDHTILMQCVTVLLSYLPEAGQYSCIFVYLKLKMSFNTMEVSIFIAVVGILSISVQVTLGYLMRKVGAKQTIILGLILEMTQLFWYGFGSQKWMMWAAGILAALGSITYPAISAFVSIHSTADSQGAVQGMVTGMRGLCNGLGPAMFGIIFYLFNVDLNDEHALIENATIHVVNGNASSSGGNGGANGGFAKWLQMPGPPFTFGGFMVILAILVALFIPEYHSEFNFKGSPIEKKRISLDVQYEIECGPTSTSPLMHSDSLAQL